MSDIDYSKLAKSLERLREQHKNFLSINKENLSDINKEAIQESVIKRFEICFDTFWKSLKKYMESQGIAEIRNSPKPIFRMAYQNKIMEKETLENFIDYTNTRIDTSHDYNMKKVEQALSKIKPFIRDTTEIYKIFTKIK